jgi:hypothetical protein
MDALIRALPKLISAAGGGEEVTEAAARIAWRRVAGEPLRRHAVLFRLFRTTLVIAVSDAIWQKQLVPLSAQLLSRLNAVLGRGTVTFIEFRIDPKTVASERGDADGVATITAAEAIGAVPQELHAAANAISDEALRRRFLLAAGASILRRESFEVGES